MASAKGDSDIMVFILDIAGESFLFLLDLSFSVVSSSMRVSGVSSSARVEFFILSCVSFCGLKVIRESRVSANNRVIRWERSMPPNLESGVHRMSHVKNGKSTESPTCLILRRRGWADGVFSVELEVSSVELEVSSVELEGDVLVEAEELVKVCPLFSGNSGGGSVMGVELVWGSFEVSCSDTRGSCLL